MCLKGSVLSGIVGNLTVKFMGMQCENRLHHSYVGVNEMNVLFDGPAIHVILYVLDCCHRPLLSLHYLYTHVQITPYPPRTLLLDTLDNPCSPFPLSLSLSVCFSLFCLGRTCLDRMTKCDVKNYLEKIYNVPVATVRTRIQYGECLHCFAQAHTPQTAIKFTELGVVDTNSIKYLFFL